MKLLSKHLMKLDEKIDVLKSYQLELKQVMDGNIQKVL